MPKVHICGIGGEGWSWIAKVLIEKGWQVSGCDINKNVRVGELKKIGLKDFKLGHSPAHINRNLDYFLYTSAILNYKKPLEELSKASKLGINSFDRNAFFKVFLNKYNVIAISGTHGKTSTSSITAFLLDSLGDKCGFGIGGIPKNFSINGRVGDSKNFVVEADEFGNAFHGLTPSVGVITSLEHDHPDFFPRFNDYLNSFKKFSKKVKNNGVLIGFGDNFNIKNLLKNSKLKTISYGFNKDNDYVVSHPQLLGLTTSFWVTPKGFPRSRSGIKIKIPFPGFQYALNSTASLLVCVFLGYSLKKASLKLLNYQGVKRRFEYQIINGITLVDDYAHHPTELKITLDQAKLTGKRVIVVYEPHQYNRCFAFKEQFKGVFKKADIFIQTSIYASRESPPFPISNEEFYKICAKGVKRSFYVNTWEKSPKLVKKLVKKGDLILVMGVGNGSNIVSKLSEIFV